jgi:serine/threonine protein kinase/WD40 repeat protein
MNDSQTSSQETRSHDAVVEAFLQELDDARDEAAIANLLVRAVVNYPERADELVALATGFKHLRGMRDPERLGQYRIRRVLAVGGMGKLYEAEEDELHRTVVVKTIKFGRVADTHLLDRFERERRTLARLHHTNIVPIYAAGREAELLYFSMPRIHGPSLRTLIRVASTLPEASSSPPAVSTFDQLVSEASAEEVKEQASRAATEVEGTPHPEATESQNGHAAPLNVPRDYHRRVATLMADVAEAVHHAHQAGVIHRDLKPANIMVERQGHPWVLDFGLAHFQGEIPSSPANPDSIGAADAGGPTAGVGTPLYWAPEQVPPAHRPCDGEPPPPIDQRTDVWGLGVTLYELLTLRRPFSRVEQILAEPPLPPNRIANLFPRELGAICLMALEKAPNDRYPTALALADDLRRWLEVRPTAAGEAPIRRTSTPFLGWFRIRLRRLGFWSRRRPAAAFAAGMTVAFAVVSLLEAGQAVRVNRAEASAAHAEAAAARAEARAAVQEVQAKKRELDLIAIPRMRAPIRYAGWAETAWTKTRELASGRPDADSRFQGEFAALLEGLDVRLTKAFQKDADKLAFDPEGKRLLMGRSVPDARGRPVTRLVMGDLSGQEGPSEKTFKGFGVVGFGTSGTALFLEIDSVDPSILRLRDAIIGDEKRILKSPRNGKSRVISIALSRDGLRAAGVVWPLRKRTPEEMAAVADKADEMTPAGDRATFVVWGVDTGRVLRSIEDKLTPTHVVTLSPDGSLLATWDPAGHRHEVAVWSVGDGTLVGRLPSAHNTIASVAFGRDPVWRDDVRGISWRLAVGEHGGKITVWDLSTRAVGCIARGSDYDVKTLDFSPDGAMLASAGRNYLMIWDATSGECLLRVPAGNYSFAVAFSPDGRRMAISKTPAFGTAEGVDVFDLDDARGLRSLRGLSQRIEKVAISADGRRVAALSNDWEVGVFDTLSGALLGVADAPEGYFTDNAALALNADGLRLVCSAGTEAKLWDVGAGHLLRKWELPPALTEAAGFHPDGRLLLIRQETKGGKVPPFGSRETHPKNHPRVCRAYGLPEQGDRTMVAEIFDFDWYVEHIAAIPDGAYFVIQGISTSNGKRARIIHLYDGSTGKPVGSIPTAMPPGDSISMMRFDPKGTRLTVLTKVRSPAEIFEVPSLKSLGPAEVEGSLNVGASRGVWYHASTPGIPGMIVVTDRTRPEPFLRIVRDVHKSGSDAIKFSQDGNQIVWGNQDGTVTACDLNEVQRRLAGVGLGW